MQRRRHRNRLARMVVAALGAVALLAALAVPAGAQDESGVKAAVVRDGNHWLLNDELGGGAADQEYVYGNAQEGLHVMGDWDGDGDRTPGVLRSDGGDLVWYLHNENASGPADIVVRYGTWLQEDLDAPVVGDWDGDGDETIGFVRPDYDRDVFEWRLDNGFNGETDVAFAYGKPGAYGQLDPRARKDLPVVGDWDGDGVTDPGVVRQDAPGHSFWLLRTSLTGGHAQIEFVYGLATDRPLPGDWDGDGTVTPGVVRNGGGNNLWLLRDTLSGGTATMQFYYGNFGDIPLLWRSAGEGLPGDTDPSSQEGTGDPVALTDIEVGRHDTYDRVVFEFAGGGQPGWEVQYVDQATGLASGQPIEVEGDATLRVQLTNTGYPQDVGVPAYEGPARIDGPVVIEEVVYDTVFEGITQAFVGTQSQLPFRVFRLTGPDRIVVDVFHE